MVNPKLESVYVCGECGGCWFGDLEAAKICCKED